MTTLKIKIKIGENEFEADGPPDACKRSFRPLARFAALSAVSQSASYVDLPEAERRNQD
jgi:hypothetical protein